MHRRAYDNVDNGAHVDRSSDLEPATSLDSPRDRRGLSDRTDRSLAVTFHPGRLYSLRAAVAAHGTRLGMDADRVTALLVVANELVANVIRHGGGSGQLRLWRQAESIYCQVSDLGPGIAEPQLVGTQPPTTRNNTGRGLWVVRQLADECTVTSSQHGTTITVAFHAAE